MARGRSEWGLGRHRGELRAALAEAHAVVHGHRHRWLAIAMALATTVFAVVDGVLFKPLPYERPRELYLVSGGYQEGQSSGIVVAPRNLRDWAAAAPGISITGFTLLKAIDREAKRIGVTRQASSNCASLIPSRRRPIVGSFAARPATGPINALAKIQSARRREAEPVLLLVGK